MDVYIEEDTDAAYTYAAALIFVKWSPDGAQPVDHLETHYLAHANRRSDVRNKLHALSLHEVKDHLEQLIDKRKELPDW